MHAIEPCPSISSGVGRVVTGTFTHVRGGILRIKLAGLAEPLGVTSNHSIYSADRLDFVPAGELRVGETLRNLDGDVRIESIEQLGTEERVYNLEIHGEHVFRVASSGVLVHNASGNSYTSANAQHGYHILDSWNGDKPAKIEVSGGPLNKNGTSPRANSQVNAWNNEPGNAGRF